MDEGMDWKQYFGSLSDNCLEEISKQLYDEQLKRWKEKMDTSLPALSSEEIDLAIANERVRSIKTYKYRTGKSLRESIYAVDAFIKLLNIRMKHPLRNDLET